MIDLLAASNDWAKAHLIAENSQNPDVINATWLKHANYLAENDEFNAAQKAFMQANQPEKAIKVLNELTKNAIIENRFLDASNYFYKISLNFAQNFQSVDSNQASNMQQFYLSQKSALIYYLYDIVYEYAFLPFLLHDFDDHFIFHAARWLWLELDTSESNNYENVNYAAVLYTLAKKAFELKCFKVARLAYQKLRTLKIPKGWRSRIEIDQLKVMGKPFQDDSNLQIACSRCESLNQIFPIKLGNSVEESHGHHQNSTTNFDLLTGQFKLLDQNSSNRCQTCGEPFIMNLASLEVMNVVEFYLSSDLESYSLEDLNAIIGSRCHLYDHSKNKNKKIVRNEDSETTILNNINEQNSNSRLGMSLASSSRNTSSKPSIQSSVDRLTLTNLTGLDSNVNSDTDLTTITETTLTPGQIEGAGDAMISNVNSLTINGEQGNVTNKKDIFVDILHQNPSSIENYVPLKLTRDQLSLLKHSEIIITKCKGVNNFRLFKNMMGSISAASFDDCIYGGLASKYLIEILNIKMNHRCPFMSG